MKEEFLHKYLLKKIKKEIAHSKSILHLSEKHNAITEAVSGSNQYFKSADLEQIKNKNFPQNSFSYVIVDLDHPVADGFLDLLNFCKEKLLAQSGLLIVVASNLTWENKLNFWLGNNLQGMKRPYRAVTPGYLRETLLENNFSIQNRFWQYDNKLLIMAGVKR